MKLTKEKQSKLNQQLFDAIESNNLEEVKAAVVAGADVNARANCGWTPLFQPMSNSVDIKIMSFLSQHGADPMSNSVDIKIMSFLLQHGADPNLQNEYGGTALHQISFYGDVAKAKLLLEYNADMYIKNNYGLTPFTTALRWEKHVAELYVLNGYIPTEEDFEIIKNIDVRNELKTRFMELARTVKVNAVQAEAESEAYSDECFDF